MSKYVASRIHEPLNHVVEGKNIVQGGKPAAETGWVQGA